MNLYDIGTTSLCIHARKNPRLGPLPDVAPIEANSNSTRRLLTAIVYLTYGKSVT